MASQVVTAPIDRKRYRRIRRFFLGILFQALLWDVLCNRPGLRWLRPAPLPRWQQAARRFRALALEMGGVLIKLGQFLSIRVDILPPEITRELAGLQDEVPPAPVTEIVARIEADFGRPIDTIFASLTPEPLGAASLAQVHRVRLLSGEDAVVKVLRPGVEVLVETDLAAVDLVLRWLKRYHRIRERVDLDWLAEEFGTVTRRELDFQAEIENAARLAEDFRDDDGICLPRFYTDYCRQKTLTLENVGYIKIGDTAAMRAAGISPEAVADRLYSRYMQQVFETWFVHVDPHPGNLFVRPLPTDEEKSAGHPGFAPGDPVPAVPDRPFQIVFIDFGMMVPVPERLRQALREYAIGLGSRDARKIVNAFVQAGTLLPGADLKRLEAVHQAALDRFWGVQVSRMRDTALKEARYFLKEFQDVIREAPFQFQVDMLFIVRAIGILMGLAAHLDPDFDVWTKTLPFARRYAGETIRSGTEEWFREALRLLQTLYRLPADLSGVLQQAREEGLTVRPRFSTEARQTVRQLGHAVDRLGWRVLAGCLAISSAVFRAGDPDDPFWLMAAVLAAAAFVRGGRRK